MFYIPHLLLVRRSASTHGWYRPGCLWASIFRLLFGREGFCKRLASAQNSQVLTVYLEKLIKAGHD